LTEKGKQLIKKKNSLHLVIDLANASPETIDDIFVLKQSPVLISHTDVKSICDNNRNLSYVHLMEIRRRNGLICIGFWETPVCYTYAVATTKSIRYVADKVGVNKVATWL